MVVLREIKAIITILLFKGLHAYRVGQVLRPFESPYAVLLCGSLVAARMCGQCGKSSSLFRLRPTLSLDNNLPLYV